MNTSALLLTAPRKYFLRIVYSQATASPAPQSTPWCSRHQAAAAVRLVLKSTGQLPIPKTIQLSGTAPGSTSKFAWILEFGFIGMA